MVAEMANLSHTFLETLISSIDSLNKAFSKSNSQEGGFEENFLQASRSYLYARRSVFAKLDEADMLIELMRESLAQLEIEPSFWSLGPTSLLDVHGFVRDRLDLSAKRLRSFRSAISWRDEQLQKNFGIVSFSHSGDVTTNVPQLHELINMRDGRVSKAIAETSEQIARESKRDSSAMKTLAVLATVFLPPTFVAVSTEYPYPPVLDVLPFYNVQLIPPETLFSTPWFNFTAPTSSILSSQFWIYWAVSIPLTIIVILLWAIWYRWSVNRHRIEDERQSDKEAIFGAFEYPELPEFAFRNPTLSERRKKFSPATPNISYLAGR
jgi:hypothetical protein